jgi:hypothetical protein
MAASVRATSWDAGTSRMSASLNRTTRFGLWIPLSTREMKERSNSAAAASCS